MPSTEVAKNYPFSRKRILKQIGSKSYNKIEAYVKRFFTYREKKNEYLDKSYAL